MTDPLAYAVAARGRPFTQTERALCAASFTFSIAYTGPPFGWSRLGSKLD
jgi:hypothetical protein